MKRKHFEITCLCEAEFDLVALLSRFFQQEQHLDTFGMLFPSVDLEDLRTMFCEPMTFSNSEIRWSPEHPPITLSELSGPHAARAAREAQLEFSELLRDNPGAWYSSSDEIKQLAQRLVRFRFVASWRGPELETQPVTRASFWLAQSMAEAVARQAAGIVRLREKAFLLGNGQLIAQ